MTIDQYRQMHEVGHFKGLSTLDWADDIGAMLKEHGCVTVLDYGSGKGLQYEPPHELHKRWGIPKPTLYDPAVPEHATLAYGRKFDAVVCSDVLEHLEGIALHDAVNDCLVFAEKAAFFSICCRPAKKSLPDGRNCHLTIQPPTWWAGYFAGVTARWRTAKPPPIVLRFET